MIPSERPGRDWLPEDLDGLAASDSATLLFSKRPPELDSPCLALDVGAGEIQHVLSKKGVEVLSANSLFQNHSAAAARSRGAWQEIRADLDQLPAGPFGSGVFRLSKSTERNHALFAALWQRLRPGALLVAYGPNEGGVKGFQHKLERAGVEVEILSMGKGSRLLGVIVQGECPLNPERESFVLQDLEIPTEPGVFSAGRLDRGTELLLAKLPNLRGQRVVDLGCGSGVVSWAALQKGAKKVWACDNYLPAVQSTQKLLAAHGEAAEALWDFTGGSLKPYKADFVLTNPPFHQEKRMNHRIGERWIRAAERLLRDDGSLILVANRFLDYPAYAADLFHDIQEIHGDKAFRVLRMIKRNTPPQGEDLDQWNAYLADQKNQARKAVEGN